MKWDTLLAIAGGVVVLGNAIERIIWAWNKARKPEADQNDRLTSLEERMGKMEHDKEKFFRRLNGQDEASRVLEESILALLGHAIDGNNTEQMTTARDKLNHYLINH